MGEYDYLRLLQAVENYYGTGSDQWAALATSSASASEMAAILKQVPGVTTTVSESGQLISWSLDATPSAMSAAETAAAETAQAINSNTTMVAVKELSVPGNAVLNETTGLVEMSSGATKMTGAAAGSKAATAAGHVGTWVIGAAVGMKLGVWIDAGLYKLYEHNPDWDFWDPATVEYLNPERWKEDRVTNWLYDYSGYDDFLALVGDDGQLYVDENVFALMAQYLNSQGAFGGGYAEAYLDDKTPLRYPNNIVIPVDFVSSLESTTGYEKIEILDNSAPVYSARINIAGQSEVFYACSVSPFNVKQGSTTRAATKWSYNGIDYYCIQYYPGRWGNTNLPRNNYTYPGNANWVWDFAYVIHNGDIVQPGHEGFNVYAPVPQGITDQMTPEDIIALLKQQYPEIWNPTDPTQPGPLRQGVLQDDGTITDHVYLPVPTPDGGTDGKPETTPETPGKTDPQNPVSTERIVKIVQPTPNPVDQPDPDTGEGNTPVAPAPTGSADALYKIYNPTNAQIQQFGAWLWSSNFVDQLLKVFNDPMQAIISLHKIYATPHNGGTAEIKVGYLNSGVSSKWVDQQYIDVNCGSVNVFETSGNVIDYMCDIRIYLPFIGIVSLDVDDVMRGVVNVKYRIDVITGTCVAFVSITRDAGAGGVIYQYTGSMAEVYPLSSGSYMGIITGVLGIAAGIAGTIASGGAAAPALIGGAAGVSAMHTKVEHSNGFSGNAGALAAKKPYIIISRPQSAMSNGIGANTGWPANYYVKLSQCSGYTRAKTLHLSGISGATDTELQEIERLLKEGVII